MLFFRVFFVLLFCGTASAVPETVELSNARLRTVFKSDGHSLLWLSLKDLQHGRDYIAGSSVFFRLSYLDANQATKDLFNHSYWDDIQLAKEADSLKITFHKKELFEVNFTIKLVGARLEESASVKALSSVNVPKAFFFPYLESVELPSENYLLVPERSGRVLKRVMQQSPAFSYSGTYPSGWTPLPLSAYYDSLAGVYLSTHDPKGFKKNLLIKKIDYGTHQRLVFSFSWPVQHLNNPISLPGTQVIQFMDGDWYDASQIYRRWVKQAVPARFSHPISKNLNEIAFWIMGECGSTALCIDPIAKFQAQLGLPIGLHWYRWHQIPFDKEYPHFFPAIPEFSSLVSDLRLRSVHVMPYLNAIQWDKNLSDFPAADAILNEQGKLVLFPNTTLSQMCPTRTHFHDTISKTSETLVLKNQVSGIYLDQLAAVPPSACSNQKHDHPIDGGDWFGLANQKFLRTLKKKGTVDTFFTSEWVNEIFVGQLDGMLTNYFSSRDQVPLFNAVYNDAVRTFGRFHWRGVDVVKAYRMKLGQSLVYGNQLGWLRLDLLETAEVRSLSLAYAKLRNAFRQYFDGKLERPVKIQTTLPEIVADWNYYWKPTPVSLPPVLSGTFEAADRKVISVLVNVSESSVHLNCAPMKWSSYATTEGADVRNITLQEPVSTLVLAAGQAVVVSERVSSMCQVTLPR